jgi:transcriptional regulator with XRE-family HTH domain
MDSSANEELASCLRTWRERLSPADVGLPARGQRRVQGLRREEVAQLAGVSMDYLTRLEQGRATSPSSSVLGSLARALRLGDVERDHMYRLAHQPLPLPGVIDTHIPASVLRLMDRLGDASVMVRTVAGELIAANHLAMALFAEAGGEGRRERTLAWRHFMGLPSIRVHRNEQDRIDAEEVLVADLQHAQASYPADTYLSELIRDLRAESPHFNELWCGHSLRRGHAREKHFIHPEVGELTLNCDDLLVEGTALSLAVFTAEPGSPSAQALELLSTIGLQRFDASAA